MKNLTRAQRKQARKQFAVGDVVTWGESCVAHRVVEVTDRGCVVDVTSCVARDGTAAWWATPRSDGTYVLLVLFDSNMQGNRPRCRFRERGVTAGPVRHSDLPPDVYVVPRS